MGHVFISHSEMDFAAVKEIVTILEHAGYRTWFFERDSVPGTSYLVQIQDAIDKCVAVVLVASSNSISSDQVTKEVVAAFERRKAFFPVLLDITPPQLKERQREWRHALGGTAFIRVDSDGIPECVTRVIDGLKALGIGHSSGATASKTPSSVKDGRTTKHPSDKALVARKDVNGERRRVTVLFADVGNFTSTTGEIDPELAHDLIVDCMALMTEEIHHYDGTVTQLMSQGVMALFGAPITHEDSPRRALHAALAIGQRLADLANITKQKGIEFASHIGLNTGLVILGRIGDGATAEYTTVGDTVEGALGMMSLARPWTIQVSESTHRLTEEFFEFRYVGEINPPGKDSTKAYQLIDVGGARTRIGASASRGLTPFVGRSLELDHLVESIELVKEGKGQVVGIVGEAGVGKSRLLLQLRERLQEKEYCYLEGGCYHYGDSIPFLPLLSILRSCFGIEEGEADSSAKHKIQEKLRGLDPRLEGEMTPLQDVLSLKVDDEQYFRLDPPRKRERTFKAIRNVLMRLSQDLPLIMVVEDLHWIDRPSQEFLSYLIPSVAHSKILIILLYRPKYNNPWINKPYCSQIRVNEFSPETSSEMIQAVLSEGEAAPEIKELIQTHAMGNPLFIEEFIRSLLDRGAIKRNDGHYLLTVDSSDIHIPDTIQGIIDSRIAQLDDRPRQTLQVASVIGRSFSLPVLQNVMVGVDDLDAQLVSLQAGEFIYEVTSLPEPEYVFKHALTQEVAYNNLLLKKRREVHDRIGRVIEELFPDRLEEFFEILAHHFARSDDQQKAFQYLRLSSIKTGSRNSMVESIRFGREAVAALNRMPRTDENKRKGIEIRLLLSGPLAATGWGGDGLQMMEEGAELARELGDTRSLADFFGSIALCRAAAGNVEIAIDCAEKAYKAATATEDVALIATVCFELCLVCNIGDRRNLILETVPKVLALLEEKNMETSTHIGKYYNFNLYSVLQSYYGRSLACLGDFERGLSQCQKAHSLAENIGNIYSLALADLLLGAAFVAKGEGRQAIEYLQKSVESSESGQMTVVLQLAPTVLGHAHLLLGDLETARHFFEKRIELYHNTQYASLISMNYYGLGLVSLESGELEAARGYFEESIRLGQKHGERAYEGMSSVCLGKVICRLDPSRSENARKSSLAGIRILKNINLRPLEAQAYLHLGELHAELGEWREAWEYLRQAREWLQEMGMHYFAGKADSAIRHLETLQEAPVVA